MGQFFEFVSKHNLKISLAILGLAFIIFYPTTYVTIDEHDYLENAVNIVEGNLRQDCIPREKSLFKVDGYCVYKYNIGTSFFYVPAVMIDKHLSFVVTFAVFCIGIVVFNKLLQESKVNPVFTCLYAFFPAFVYYSRTLFSEIFSATFVLSAYYFMVKFIKKDRFMFGILAGFCFGVSVLVRYTNVVALSLLFLGMFIISSRELVQKRSKINYKFILKKLISKIIPVLIGVVPFLIFVLLFNKYLYGGALRSGYYFSKVTSAFSISNIPIRLFKYSAALLLLYPGMLVLGLKGKNKYQWPIALLSIALVVFYSAFRADKFEGKITDLILGVRYFVPVIPLLLFIYVEYLNKFIKKSLFKWVLVVSLIVLSGNVFLLHYVHQVFLDGFPGI